MEYVELKCKTHYSFLTGASYPYELVDQARQIGLRGLAITDINGVYGIPKAYLSTKSAAKSNPTKSHSDFKLIVGAEVSIQNHPPLTLLCQNRASYGLLCRILTQAHRDKPKGIAYLTWNELLHFMENPAAQNLIGLPNEDYFLWDWKVLKDLFGSRLYLPLARILDYHDHQRTATAKEIGQNYDIKIVATNDVYYHHPLRRNLQDILTAVQHKTNLHNAGTRLFPNHERYLKSPEQMRKLFADMPETLACTLEIAESCTFSLSELRYRYPNEWIPKGESAQSYLTTLVWKGAEQRYSQQIPKNVRNQLEYELTLIEQLQFADYFLTIWDIVDFARSQDILCQGRGSAANSAVCYALGITAIDPVRMSLLFERFISAERGEPPDIDVDFEHERREEVIQYIYTKYGREKAAMVSAVVTYRSRSATREVTKVFGKELSKREFEKALEAESKDESLPNGLLQLQRELIEELQGFPRHLSIHSGGFIVSADPVIETVPIEPARMEGRTIIQWDKYDLDALGLLKVDILALGMLSALKKTFALIGGHLTLATIPPEDYKTYQMIQRADTIGTFQIESRAQMSMLPRLLPKTFYDLVIEVALVRPGPIIGKMVHPYLKRRKGLEPVWIPDPRLESILGRTLGIPIFQEQVMKMAIVLANFTPGEADQLRRAIGAWRSSGSIGTMGKRLIQGLLENGIPQSYADLIFQQIQGFAEYGFPESHSASFALIAYASSYLKCYYPAEFTCALLNSQPMGFYSPHTLVNDVKRHGVTVHPLDPHLSDWECKLEQGAIRIGFRYVSGISEQEISRLLIERKEKPFQNLADFLDRCSLKRNILHRLALGDAFACFQLDQRTALWQILGYQLLNYSKSPVQLSLFSGYPNSITNEKYLFKRMNDYEAISADYAVYGLSTRGHLMGAIRKRFPNLPKMTATQAKNSVQNRVIRISGLSIIMQRPPTASGTAFATLEDETGFLDLIFFKTVYERFKEVIMDHCFVIIQGKIQRDGLSVSLVVQNVKPLDDEALFKNP